MALRREGGAASGRDARTVVRPEELYIVTSICTGHTTGRASASITGAGAPDAQRGGQGKGAVPPKATEATRATGGPGRKGVFFPMFPHFLYHSSGKVCAIVCVHGSGPADDWNDAAKEELHCR